jgi:hypothetical protein
MALTRSLVLLQRGAQMKKIIFSRNACVPQSVQTTLTIVPATDTAQRWPVWPQCLDQGL